MKKVVLFALLLATAAAAASAEVLEPRWGAYYRCDYQNYSGNAKDLGYSVWHSPLYYNPGGTLLIRAKETFTTSYGTDTYNVSWAKPANRYFIDPITGERVLVFTRWEFTFNPYGPQCTSALVSNGGDRISFQSCSDGHSRVCEIAF